MTERSLDEFVSTDETPDHESVEPATAISRWTPSGGTCDVCDTETQRLWVDDGDVVCASCKDW